MEGEGERGREGEREREREGGREGGKEGGREGESLANATSGECGLCLCSRRGTESGEAASGFQVDQAQCQQ